MRKLQKGKLYTFKFLKRKSTIAGIVLGYTDEWTLIKDINDYNPDGYTIFKNDKVEVIEGEFEKFATKILKLKKYSFRKEPKFPIGKLEDMLLYIDRKYSLIQ